MIGALGVRCELGSFFTIAKRLCVRHADPRDFPRRRGRAAGCSKSCSEGRVL